MVRRSPFAPQCTSLDLWSRPTDLTDTVFRTGPASGSGRSTPAGHVQARQDGRHNFRRVDVGIRDPVNLIRRPWPESHLDREKFDRQLIDARRDQPGNGARQCPVGGSQAPCRIRRARGLQPKCNPISLQCAEGRSGPVAAAIAWPGVPARGCRAKLPSIPVGSARQYLGHHQRLRRRT